LLCEKTTKRKKKKLKNYYQSPRERMVGECFAFPFSTMMFVTLFQQPSAATFCFMNEKKIKARMSFETARDFLVGAAAHRARDRESVQSVSYGLCEVREPVLPT
jgi:hypothetical protein